MKVDEGDPDVERRLEFSGHHRYHSHPLYRPDLPSSLPHLLPVPLTLFLSGPCVDLLRWWVYVIYHCEDLVILCENLAASSLCFPLLSWLQQPENAELTFAGITCNSNWAKNVLVWDGWKYMYGWYWYWVKEHAIKTILWRIQNFVTRKTEFCDLYKLGTLSLFIWFSIILQNPVFLGMTFLFAMQRARSWTQCCSMTMRIPCLTT